jgi:hypothetical protein
MKPEKVPPPSGVFYIGIPPGPDDAALYVNLMKMCRQLERILRHSLCVAGQGRRRRSVTPTDTDVLGASGDSNVHIFRTTLARSRRHASVNSRSGSSEWSPLTYRARTATVFSGGFS